ncbi:hypothetical protein AB0H60_29810 [Nocardia rhamnosiphila]|uniref:hypothetical protein n=1 Tax=Nocardia rhamnosiphila TaxID=426716 RepID=UPI00340F83D8
MTRTHRPMTRSRSAATNRATTANPLTLHDLQIVSEVFGFGSVAALVTGLLEAPSDPPGHAARETIMESDRATFEDPASAVTGFTEQDRISEARDQW